MKRIVAAAVLAVAVLTGAACDPQGDDYWYCWDEGDPDPHHYGYPVDGDHPCTSSELGYEAPEETYP